MSLSQVRNSSNINRLRMMEEYLVRRMGSDIMTTSAVFIFEEKMLNAVKNRIAELILLGDGCEESTGDA